jgi:hypothetical protein
VQACCKRRHLKENDFDFAFTLRVSLNLKAIIAVDLRLLVFTIMVSLPNYFDTNLTLVKVVKTSIAAVRFR